MRCLAKRAAVASLVRRPRRSTFFDFQINAYLCWPCGVVGDALASSKRSGKSTGLLLASYAATYALRNIGPAEENRPGKSDEAIGQFRAVFQAKQCGFLIQFAALPDFLFRYQA